VEIKKGIGLLKLTNRNTGANLFLAERPASAELDGRKFSWGLPGIISRRM
jgi:hypothetical protein